MKLRAIAGKGYQSYRRAGEGIPVIRAVNDRQHGFRQHGTGEKQGKCYKEWTSWMSKNRRADPSNLKICSSKDLKDWLGMV
jgi:hypothetical protein